MISRANKPLHDTSVVLCTRNRPDGALAAVTSVLRDVPTTQVIVVDQSQSDETERLLRPVVEGARGRVIRADPRGLGVARNLGVTFSSGAYIAFTDDDCEVCPGWLAGIRTALFRDPRLGLVFGNVVAPDYDRTQGFVPSYEVPRYVVADHIEQKTRIEGMGACMGILRETWQRLGGFDEALGSGAPFRAGEDADFAVRALLAGWHVAETPAAAVVHHGFRTWAQRDDLIAGYMYGLGAVNMKMLRMAGWHALQPLTTLASRWLVGEPVIDLNHVPPRLARLFAFLRGAREGMRTPLDRNGRFTDARSPQRGHVGHLGSGSDIRDARSGGNAGKRRIGTSGS